MLKKFTVGNFLSFHHHQSFTMTSSDNHRVIHTLESSLNQFSAVYGENKKDIFTAIEYARNVFINHTAIPKGNMYSKALLSNEQAPSSFDFEIFIEGKMYSVGFEINTTNKKIAEQWLLQIDKGKKEILYYWNLYTGNFTYSDALFSDSEFNSIVESNDADSLIISKWSSLELFENANNTRTSLFNSIIGWFSSLSIIEYKSSLEKNCRIQNSVQVSLDYFRSILKEASFKRVLNSEKNFDALVNDNEIPHVLCYWDGTLYVRESKEWYQISFTKGSPSFYSILFIILTMSEKSPLFINDIEKDLSPSQLLEIIRIYFRIVSTQKLQLVIGTQEISLLDISLLKKSEMWFITSGEYSASRLISYDCFFFDETKDIAKAYLDGEFSTL